MKKILLAVLAVATLFFSVNSNAAEEPKFSVALDAAYYSHYVGEISGNVSHDNSVFQQSVTLTHNPSGIYALVWNSYSPKGGVNSDYGDEVDYIIGFSKEIRGFTVDAGYAFYDLHKIGHTEGDLHALYLNVDAPEIHSIVPYLKVEINLSTDKDILEGGVMYRAGIKHSIEIAKQTIDLDLSIAGNDGAYGYVPDLVSSGKLGISTTFRVWKLEITPEINLQKVLGHTEEDGGIAGDKAWWGTSISLPL